MSRARRASTSLFVVVLAGTLTLPVVHPSAAMSVGASIVFDDPTASGPVTAGDVRLSGTVHVDGATPGTTTALYLVDVSTSTMEPRGMDCNANGVIDAPDDVNRDERVGDVLDCEINGVRALDAKFAASGNVLTGLVAFSSGAAVADLDPGPATTSFLPAGYAGTDPRSRMSTVARGLARDRIKHFQPIDLDTGQGTNIDRAVRVALTALAPVTGPRWIILLSDGLATAKRSTLEALESSGVRLRAFAVGSTDGCSPDGALHMLARRSGDDCISVTSPARLATALVSSQPREVESVEVAVGGVTATAAVDAVGTWSTRLAFGPGTYTAVVRARLRSGAWLMAERTFTVSTPPPPGGKHPTPVVTLPPGVVQPTTGTLLAARMLVERPGPTRAALPKRVRGMVRPAGAATAVSVLAGAQVRLQGRRAGSKAWTSLTRSSTNASGVYQLRWHRRAKIVQLRVVLVPGLTHSGAKALVRRPEVSSCSVVATAPGRHDVTCHTTAPAGSRAKAKVKVSGKVVDKAVVSGKRVTVTVTGRVSKHSLVVRFSPTHRVVLRSL